MLERSQAASRASLLLGTGKQTLEEAVAAFWRHHSRRRSPLRSSVARLAELALAAEGEIAAEGTRVLFERIIEPLCDGFTRRGAETYRRMFAQIIMAARRRTQCRALDEALMQSGLVSERDLLRVPAPVPPRESERGQVRKVIVLSRLTLGADVSVTMPILHRAEALFPRARIAFIGGDGAGVIARSYARVDHVHVPYGRTDYLAERLNAWPVLADTVRAQCADLAPEEYLLIDSDSRLTQLGLLRPVPDERYFHFPSRSYNAHATDSLSIMAARWMGETFGMISAPDTPLRVADAEARWAEALRAACEDRPLISVNFGVGGNERKRAGLAFETELLEYLVERGNRVLLARGADRDEVGECDMLCTALTERGITVEHLPTGCTGIPAQEGADVVTWQANVDAFVASIRCADLYVGYDSAGQHIAAALGVPVLTLFIEAAGRRHALRWAPQGRGIVRILRSPWPPDRRELLEHAREALTQLEREIDLRTRALRPATARYR